MPFGRKSARKSANKSSKKSDAGPGFEESLSRLEEIVHLLEEGEIGLNEALARYEEGVKLLRRSYGSLERVERKIELLSGVDAEGNPVTQPFDDEATHSAGEHSGRKGPSGGASDTTGEFF